jgi:membrane-associated protease RseP (regulator of RpoE activity)
MEIILIIILVIIISTLFHMLGNLVACYIFRIKVESVHLFFGKPIFQFQLKSLKFKFGYIPTGGNIKYNFEDFLTRNLITRLLIVISGPFFILLSTIIILNVNISVIELIKGFEQIILGFISPINLGTKFIHSFNEFYSKNTLLLSYAILSTKIAAFNLLPIPPLSGGQFIVELFPIFKKIKYRLIINNIGLIIGFILMAVWIFSFIYAQFIL